MNKDRVYLILSVLFLAASGWILYNTFYGNGTLLSFIPTNLIPTAVTETQVTSNNVQVLDQQIENSIRNLGPSGAWQQLTTNPQYNQLSGDALLNIDIGAHGGRANPFEPLKYAPTDVKQ